MNFFSFFSFLFCQ